MANYGAQLRSGTAAQLYADMLPEVVLEREKDFFAISLRWEPIAGGATIPRSAVIQNDADFLIVNLNGTVFDAGVVTQPATRPLRLTIEDTGSGRLFQSGAMDWDSIVGTAQLPGAWPYPKLVPRASTVEVNLVNVDPANGFDVNLVLVGFKVFG